MMNVINSMDTMINRISRCVCSESAKKTPPLKILLLYNMIRNKIMINGKFMIVISQIYL